MDVCCTVKRKNAEQLRRRKEYGQHIKREQENKKDSRWGETFRTCPDLPCGPSSFLYNGNRESFPGVKRPRRGFVNPQPSSAEVKERVKLYLYSPSGPSWPVLGYFVFSLNRHCSFPLIKF
jgi:hypothetical protein